MKDVYRKQCAEIETVRIINVLLYIQPALAQSFIEIVDVPDFRKLTAEEYRAWIASWRVIYQYLSAIIAEAKNIGEASYEAVMLSRAANTMLNARHYARDVRRSLAE